MEVTFFISLNHFLSNAIFLIRFNFKEKEKVEHGRLKILPSCQIFAAAIFHQKRGGRVFSRIWQCGRSADSVDDGLDGSPRGSRGAGGSRLVLVLVWMRSGKNKKVRLQTSE